MALGAPLLAGSPAGHIEANRVCLSGLASSLTSMALLLASVFVKSDQPVAYPLLPVLAVAVAVRHPETRP